MGVQIAQQVREYLKHGVIQNAVNVLMVSPGLRVGREVARELLFADLGPASSAKALSRALSLAREALSALGEEVAGRLRADRAHVWFSSRSSPRG